MIDLSIKKLLDVKKDIRNAIEEKGVTIADDSNFEEYSKHIQKISGSGGSDLETSTFNNVLNNSSNKVNVGDKVFLNHVNVLSGEGKSFSDKDDVKTSYPRILSADGNFVYAPNSYQKISYVKLNGLEAKDYSTINYQCRTNLYDLAFGPNGELLTCHLRYSSGGSATGAPEEYRCDLKCWKEDSGFIHADGSTHMYSGYIGEDIYVLKSDNKNYIIKKDLETGTTLKTWVADGADWAYCEYMAETIAMYENNKLYVYDFYKNVVYIIDDATDSVTKESINISRLQSTDIRPVAITNDHKFIIFKATSNINDILHCIRRDSMTSFTELSALESGKLQLQNNFANYASHFFFNRFNQILSIKYQQKDKYLILQYVGCDNNNLPIFSEIKLSKPDAFNNDKYSFTSDNIPFTFDATGSKVVYSLQKNDGNFNYVIVQSLQDFSQFEIVDSDLCNSTSVQGIVQQTAETGAMTKVKAYKMKEATATVTTNINAEIEIVGGIQ